MITKEAKQACKDFWAKASIVPIHSHPQAQGGCRLEWRLEGYILEVEFDDDGDIDSILVRAKKD